MSIQIDIHHVRSAELKGTCNHNETLDHAVSLTLKLTTRYEHHENNDTRTIAIHAASIDASLRLADDLMIIAGEYRAAVLKRDKEINEGIS